MAPDTAGFVPLLLPTEKAPGALQGNGQVDVFRSNAATGESILGKTHVFDWAAAKNLGTQVIRRR